MFIDLPNSLTSLGSAAFDNCNSLVSILLPDKLTELNGSLFYNCNNLKALTIPKNLNNISNDTLKGCENTTVFIFKNSYPDRYIYIPKKSYITDTKLQKGDYDGTRTIDSSDALYALKASVGIIHTTESQIDRGDINGNKTIDSEDALQILKYSVGIIDKF